MDPGASRIARNPFYVLGLRPSATRLEVEREGQKLLGMLELGLRAAATYPTPLGAFPRTASDVRQAMAELRDPERRLLHELWAALDPMAGAAAAGGGPGAEGRLAPWPGARRALGWGRSGD